MGEVAIGEVAAPPKRWPYAAVPILWLLGAASGPAYYLRSIAPYGYDVNGSPDANIGAGFGVMWTSAWGWPWSLGPWHDLNIGLLPLDRSILSFTACALLNVVLVAAVFAGLYLYTRRRFRTHPGASAALKRWHYAVVPLACLVTVLAGPIYFDLQVSGVSLPAADMGVGPLSEQWNTLLGLPWSRWSGVSLGLVEAGLVNVALVSVASFATYRYKLRRSSEAV